MNPISRLTITKYLSNKVHKHPSTFKLAIDFFLIFANMNLIVFAGILLLVTAKRASLGEKNMQAASKADEPDEAMREVARPLSLVEKIMRAAAEADDPDEAKRESFIASALWRDPCKIYPKNACANGVAYGCTGEWGGVELNGAAYCWSSCTTKLGNIGYQWLMEERMGYLGLYHTYLSCDQTKPANDSQCVNKADGSDSWVCYPGRAFLGVGK